MIRSVQSCTFQNLPLGLWHVVLSPDLLSLPAVPPVCLSSPTPADTWTVSLPLLRLSSASFSTVFTGCLPYAAVTFCAFLYFCLPPLALYVSFFSFHPQLWWVPTLVTLGTAASPEIPIISSPVIDTISSKSKSVQVAGISNHSNCGVSKQATAWANWYPLWTL